MWSLDKQRLFSSVYFDFQGVQVAIIKLVSLTIRSEPLDGKLNTVCLIGTPVGIGHNPEMRADSFEPARHYKLHATRRMHVE